MILVCPPLSLNTVNSLVRIIAHPQYRRFGAVLLRNEEGVNAIINGTFSDSYREDLPNVTIYFRN